MLDSRRGKTIQRLPLLCECTRSPQYRPALWGASPGSTRDPAEENGCWLGLGQDPFVGSQATVAAHAPLVFPQNVTVTRSALCTTDATRQASASAGRARWGPSATTAFPRTTGAKDAIVSRPAPGGRSFTLGAWSNMVGSAYMGLLLLGLGFGHQAAVRPLVQPQTRVQSVCAAGVGGGGRVDIAGSSVNGVRGKWEPGRRGARD